MVVIHIWTAPKRQKHPTCGFLYPYSLLKRAPIHKLPQRTQQHLSGGKSIRQAGLRALSQTLWLLLSPFQAVSYMRRQGRCFFTRDEEI